MSNVANTKAEPLPPPLARKHIAILWGVLLVALLPAMAFLIATEREISRYSTLTFEREARAALEAGDSARAIRICTGALRTSLERSDFWGLAYLLRAKAQAAAGDPLTAMANLEVTARHWAKHYYYPSAEQRQEAKEFGAALAKTLYESGDADVAGQALSLAGIASGHPVEFLYEQAATLDPAMKKTVWPEGPRLVIEDFRDPAAGLNRVLSVTSWFEKPYISKKDLEDLQPPKFQVWAEEQGRSLVQSTNSAATEGADTCAMFEVSESTKEGRSQYAIPVYIPISPKPFGLRAWVRERQPSNVGIALEYWFEFARKAALTVDDAGVDLGQGWRLIDIHRDFAAEAKQKGSDPGGGIILRFGLGLKPGPANQYWVDRIELYIPPA